MQHLRGMEVDAERDPKADEAVFVSAPRGGSTAIGNRGAGGRRDVKNPKGATDEFESMFKKGQMVRMSEEEQQASSSSSSSKPSLPSTVLPSSTELSYQKAIESTRAIPTELTGFRPDMDPHLRQVLEALEDDAFVEVDDEDELFGGSGGAKGEDWIGELLGGGERGEDEGDLEDDFEFREEGIEDDGRPSWIAPHLRQQGDEDEEDDEDKPEETWQDRFQAFKASGGLARPSSPPPQAAAGGLDGEEQDEDAGSERADTLASLRSFAPTVNGAKNRRRKGGSRAGGSQASGYSMSSSSMFRNKGLTVLDERFEKVSHRVEGSQRVSLRIRPTIIMFVCNHRSKGITKTKVISTTTISPHPNGCRKPAVKAKEWTTTTPPSPRLPRRPLSPECYGNNKPLSLMRIPRKSRERISRLSWMISWIITRWWGRRWSRSCRVGMVRRSWIV